MMHKDNAYGPVDHLTHQAQGARFTSKDSSSDRVLPDTALMDLSLLPRLGFRGPDAADYLQQSKVALLPDQANHAKDVDEGLILRLSATEYWCLANIPKKTLDIAFNPEIPAQCYPLYCQQSHAWFGLLGATWVDILAKLCAVDLQPESFPAGSIVQTVAGRCSVIIVNHRLKDKPLFSLLCDVSYAEYLWTVLVDAMAEFSGKIIAIENY